MFVCNKRVQKKRKELSLAYKKNKEKCIDDNQLSLLYSPPPQPPHPTHPGLLDNLASYTWAPTEQIVTNLPVADEY